MIILDTLSNIHVSKRVISKSLSSFCTNNIPKQIFQFFVEKIDSEALKSDPNRQKFHMRCIEKIDFFDASTR